VQFFDVIERRRSVRAFDSKTVRAETLDRLLETVLLAPSAGDLQAYEIIAIERPELKSALAAAALGQEFIAQAPVVLVFLADVGRSESKYGRRGATLFCIQDATIAAAYAQLAAAALGLGSCWVGAFDEDRVAKVIEAPDAMRPVAILPVGFPAERPTRPPRRPLQDLVRRERAS
jgi:nitroreductase